MIWVIIILVLVYIFIIKPFLKHRDAENFGSFLALPDEIKTLIQSEKVFELSELLVDLELQGQYELCRIVLQAIDSKGFGFARRVDKVRNEMRIQAGLGPLKNF
ncbi:hypothetical protein [Elizabethkingia anophelis]|uniref:hypothetical protein n=1 Tax=Elizabethkingia anophelis TaxID=1117645 RepID=UPI000442C1C3|nr:hypothetical protein [Elizabethkingia anophelis]CDN79376.1 hypothetical protein E27107_530004 [Elizabethkingia anophelis]